MLASACEAIDGQGQAVHEPMTSDATDTMSGLRGPSSATFSCQRPLPNHDVDQLQEAIRRDTPPEGWRRPQAMQTMLCTLCTSSW